MEPTGNSINTGMSSRFVGKISVDVAVSSGVAATVVIAAAGSITDVETEVVTAVIARDTTVESATGAVVRVVDSAAVCMVCIDRQEGSAVKSTVACAAAATPAIGHNDGGLGKRSIAARIGVN